MREQANGPVGRTPGTAPEFEHGPDGNSPALARQAPRCPVCGADGLGCRVMRDGGVQCYARDPLAAVEAARDWEKVCAFPGGPTVYRPRNLKAREPAVPGHGFDSRQPPPLGGDVARIESWMPVRASELRGGGEELPWLWGRYVARGTSALLTGLWKGGKTTLLSRLIRAMGAGGDVAGAVTAGRVLVVSEESQRMWAQRRDELRIADHAAFLCRPFRARPDYPDWLAFARRLAELRRNEGYDLIALDTLPGLWSARDENDASEVLRAVAPLQEVLEAEAGLLLIHHPRKGDASEGQATRGSGALPGWVDCIVELRRFDAKSRDDRRRVLTAYSRFDTTPPEVVIELGCDGLYKTVGDRAEATRTDRLAVIGRLLADAGAPLTVEELLDRWDGESVPKPGKRTVERDLAAAPGILRSGAGTRGEPFQFAQAPTQGGPLTRIESARQGAGSNGPADRPPDALLEQAAAGAALDGDDLRP